MHTSRLPNRPGSSHSTDPKARIRYDTILKADALVATLNVVRSDALIFQDAIDRYTEPDPPEASQSTKTIPSFQAAYANAVAGFRQAHVELTQTVTEVLDQLKVDGRQPQAADMEDDVNLVDEASSTRVELPTRGVNVSAEDVEPASGRSAGYPDHPLDTFPPAASTSPTGRQYCRSSNFLLHNDPPHPDRPQTGHTDFDPFAESPSERQARYESWLSLHPGLRAAAQRSHSQQPQQEKHNEDLTAPPGPSCQQPACREARKYESDPGDLTSTPTTSVTLETRKNKRHSRRKAVSDRQPQDLMEGYRQHESRNVVLPQPRTVTPTLNEASLRPNRISTARGRGRGKGKAHEPKRSYHPPFSGPGSHLYHGTLRGGGTAWPPDTNSSIAPLTPDLRPQNSFAEALAAAHVRETDAGIDFSPGSVVMPRVSGHGLPPECTGGSNFRSEARGARERSIERTRSYSRRERRGSGRRRCEVLDMVEGEEGGFHDR